MNPINLPLTRGRRSARWWTTIVRPLQLLAVLALLLIAVSAQAADYFVDAQAPAGGNGSAANPWNSVSQVNAKVFSPGDNIYFQRGDTFAGTGLVVGQSGSSDTQRITYGAYGTGARPVIDLGGAPVNCMSVTGKNWIAIRGLHFRNSLKIAVLLREGGNHIIDDCEASDILGGGFYCKGSATNILHDVTVQNSWVHDTKSPQPGGGGCDGIAVHNGADITELVGSTFTFRNNLITGCSENSFDLTAGSNILLENNETFGSAAGGITMGHTASDITVRYHYAHDEPQVLKISVLNVTIEYSRFVSRNANPKQIVLVQPTIDVSGVVRPDGYADGQPENVVLRNNVFVWNSTVAGDAFLITRSNAVKAGLPNAGQTFNPTIQRLVMRNNIWASSPAGTGVWTINFSSDGPPPNASGFRVDNNVYYRPGGASWNVGATTYTDFNLYKSNHSPADANSRITDPKFVDAANGNYQLLNQTSSAFDAGVNNPVTIGTFVEPAFLGLDFTLPTPVSVPQGAARDIGAYELPVAGGSPPSAPASLTATAVSSTQVDLTWPDVANETGYRIQRKVGTGAYSDLTTKAANSTAHSDTTVSASTSYTYQIRAENGSGNSNYTVSNSVTTPGGGGTTTLYEAESLAFTNSDTAAITLDAGNASNDNYVLLNGTGATSFISYTVTVATAGTYDVATRITTRSNRGIYQLKIDGVNQGAAQDYYAAGTTTIYEERALGSVTLAAGNHTFRFECTGKNASANSFKQGLDYIKLTNQSSNSVPSITTTTLPGTIAGESYSQTLAATGGDGALVWSLDSGALPAGLSLSAGGVISGSATTAGTANFTVRVADSDGNTGPTDEDTQALSIIVTANSVPVITTTTLPGTITGESYSQTLAATGGNGALVWSLDSGALPAGLSLSAGGVISGSATTAGTANFTVKVADSDGVTGAGDEDTQVLSIVVTANSVPSITTTTLPAGTVGTAYSQALAATGGNGALTWSLDSGALPAGLSLSAGGVISGTPTTAGTANFTVRVADSDGNTGATDEDTQALSIVVNSGIVLYEAESLAFTNSDTAAITLDAGNASNDNYVLLNGTGTTSFISYTVNVATAGTYSVATRITTRSNRGIYQLKIDGVNQGAAQDYYAAGTTTVYEERALGSVTLSAGNHTFRFECTGKNASASQFKQGLDYIKLTPQ